MFSFSILVTSVNSRVLWRNPRIPHCGDRRERPVGLYRLVPDLPGVLLGNRRVRSGGTVTQARCRPWPYRAYPSQPGPPIAEHRGTYLDQRRGLRAARDAHLIDTVHRCKLSLCFRSRLTHFEEFWRKILQVKPHFQLTRSRRDPPSHAATSSLPQQSEPGENRQPGRTGFRVYSDTTNMLVISQDMLRV